MSADQIRRRLGETQNKRLDVEKKIADARRTQSRKNEEAATSRQRAAKATAASQQSMYARQAESAERAALAEGRRIADESKKSADLLKTETALNKDLTKALADAARDDRRAIDKRARDDKQARDREQRQARERQAALDREAAAARRRADEQASAARAENARRAAEQEALTRSLVADAETRIRAEIAAVRPPAAEPLRILFLTASAMGDLRVDEEIRRVKAGVRAATHRDLVLIDHLPAATSGDLLDGLARTLPHVVHFSGHADPTTVVLDTGSDTHGPGHYVPAAAFAAAVGAVDPPPVLVVLNACRSEAQLAGLLLHVPVAIGMSDSVGDRDAMAFAARFYAARRGGAARASRVRPRPRPAAPRRPPRRRPPRPGCSSRYRPGHGPARRPARRRLKRQFPAPAWTAVGPDANGGFAGQGLALAPSRSPATAASSGCRLARLPPASDLRGLLAPWRVRSSWAAVSSGQNGRFRPDIWLTAAG